MGVDLYPGGGGKSSVGSEWESHMIRFLKTHGVHSGKQNVHREKTKWMPGWRPLQWSRRKMALLSGRLAAPSEYFNDQSSLALSRKQQLFMTQLGLSIVREIRATLN